MIEFRISKHTHTHSITFSIAIFSIVNIDSAATYQEAFSNYTKTSSLMIGLLCSNNKNNHFLA